MFLPGARKYHAGALSSNTIKHNNFDMVFPTWSCLRRYLIEGINQYKSPTLKKILLSGSSNANQIQEPIITRREKSRAEMKMTANQNNCKTQHAEQSLPKFTLSCNNTLHLFVTAFTWRKFQRQEFCCYCFRTSGKTLTKYCCDH